MSEHGLAQLPVLAAEPPVVLGEVLGAVSERALLAQLSSGEATLRDTVESVVGAPLALIGAQESVDAAAAALESDAALMVLSDGKPVDVITRRDLLASVSA